MDKCGVEEQKVSPQRSNTTVHVCWHRNTSLSMEDSLRATHNSLSGYLLRKFKNSNGWQKLWVVFTNFCLFFYKTFQVCWGSFFLECEKYAGMLLILSGMFLCYSKKCPYETVSLISTVRSMYDIFLQVLDSFLCTLTVIVNSFWETDLCFHCAIFLIWICESNMNETKCGWGSRSVTSLGRLCYSSERVIKLKSNDHCKVTEQVAFVKRNLNIQLLRFKPEIPETKAITLLLLYSDVQFAQSNTRKKIGE